MSKYLFINGNIILYHFFQGKLFRGMVTAMAALDVI